MIERDLLGQAIIPDLPLTKEGMLERKRARRRASEVPRGYYAAPGTGPDGQTCKSCRHAVAVEYSKKYWKCEKARSHWTGGPRTDIRLRSPACVGWEAKEEP